MPWRFVEVVTSQRAVQCSSCHLKCAMCGSHLEDDDSSDCPPVSSSVNFNLCETCNSEFDDYLKMVSSQKSSGIFWHNEEWLELWSAWLDYQEAIGAFRNSKEFRQLFKESES